MRALEDFNVMESFGLMPDGIFSEVSEIDMVDVIGGSCGAGGFVGFRGCDLAAPIFNIPNSIKI